MGLGQNKIPLAFLIIDGSKVFPFNKEIIRIGRSRKNDLILANPQVSRNHAEVVFENGRFFVKDLNSLGGTYINGKEVSQYQLTPGDVITLADVHLVFGQDPSFSADVIAAYSSPDDLNDTEKNTQSLGDS